MLLEEQVFQVDLEQVELFKIKRIQHQIKGLDQMLEQTVVLEEAQLHMSQRMVEALMQEVVLETQAEQEEPLQEEHQIS